METNNGRDLANYLQYPNQTAKRETCMKLQIVLAVCMYQQGTMFNAWNISPNLCKHRRHPTKNRLTNLNTLSQW